MTISPSSLEKPAWQVATCLHGVSPVTPTGESLHDADVSVWASHFSEIAGLGFDLVEIADSHLRPADVDRSRAAEIRDAARSAGIGFPSLHVQRQSILMPGSERKNLEYAHRSIDAAADWGMGVFSTGLHQPMTKAQREALWFWTAEGAHDDDTRETWNKAVAGLRELGTHAADVGLIVSLEMYEDTLLGSANSAVRLVKDIGLPNVGLNPDVGNLVRLHRPIEDWRDMYAKTLPYANYWHLKNYIRDEAADGSWFTAIPSTLASGIINYRHVIKDAVAQGFAGVFLMEHYGGDSLEVCRINAEYVRAVLAAAPPPEVVNSARN